VPPGPEKFVADVRSSGIFHGDVQAIPSALILKIGHDECNALAAGGSYTQAILALMKTKGKPTRRAVTIVVNSAIRNLCPKYTDLILTGAATHPGPQRFLAEVRGANPALATVPDADLLNIGRAECKALALVPGVGPAVRTQAIRDAVKTGKFTTRQATVLVDSAIRNLCPKFSDVVPAGAP
jgi:hypothetical protein